MWTGCIYICKDGTSAAGTSPATRARMDGKPVPGGGTSVGGGTGPEEAGPVAGGEDDPEHGHHVAEQPPHDCSVDSAHRPHAEATGRHECVC